MVQDRDFTVRYNRHSWPAPPSRIDDRHILTILHAVVEPEALYIDNPRFSLTKAAMPCSATTARTGKR